MTYPIFFSFGLTIPWIKSYNRPKFMHDRPSVINGHYYSQRYTGFGWGPLRIGLVWKAKKV